MTATDSFDTPEPGDNPVMPDNSADDDKDAIPDADSGDEDAADLDIPEPMLNIMLWLSEDALYERRRFLEEHPALLSPVSDRILQILIAVLERNTGEFQRVTGASDEKVAETFQRYKLLFEIISGFSGASQELARIHTRCKEALQVLPAIRKNGGTIEAIRTAYVNLFSGFALDVPPWLNQAMRQFIADGESGKGTPERQAKMISLLIEQARRDGDVPPEYVAALWQERAGWLLRDADSKGSAHSDQAIAAWQEALALLSPERYPVQRARLLAYIAQEQQHTYPESDAPATLTGGQQALDALDEVERSEAWAEAQMSLGAAYLSHAQRQPTLADMQQAITCFQNALSVYRPEINPQEWAGAQRMLGMAYMAQDMEQAIQCFQQALRINTREAFPQEWAQIQANLGLAFALRTAGSREENKAQALSHFAEALQVYTRQDFPIEWAHLQRELGNFYRQCTSPTRTQNLNTAIGYYEAALSVLSLDNDPVEWATCTFNLGVAYDGLARQRAGEYVEKAIACFESVLPVYEQQRLINPWATAQINLGNAYQQRVKGDHDENIQRAIQCYQAALKVFEEYRSTTEWAELQHNIAALYLRLGGDEATNLESALHSCEAALQVYTRDKYPEEWARAQLNLGIAYMKRKKGRRADNIERALVHMHAALQVYTRDRYPEGWAHAQSALGMAYNIREEGERADNIERAIIYTEAALEVYTEADYPQRHISTQIPLAKLYSDRKWGDRRENQEKAIAIYDMALRKLPEDRNPAERASIYHLLGAIYQERLAGDHDENLARARTWFMAELKETSLQRSPDEYRLTQLNLARVYGMQGDWAAMHEAYVQAHVAGDILMRLGAGHAGQHIALGNWSSARDAGARDGFALVRMGRLQDAIVAIEKGQARIMTASLMMDTTSPNRIRDAERRARYIQVRQRYIEAQAALNTPHSPQLFEGQRRLIDRQRAEAYHAAHFDLEQVIAEIRTAADPPNFWEDATGVETILEAARCVGDGHALVYLAATPWGGIAVAAFNDNSRRGTQARIEVLNLPDLHDAMIRNLITVTLTEADGLWIGGLVNALRRLGFVLLYSDWPGLSFAGRAENLNDACFREGKSGLLDEVAQEIAHDPAFAQIVSQPLRDLTNEEVMHLWKEMDTRFMQRELRRALGALARAGIPSLMNWLVEQGATGVTFIPCGWLSAMPLAAVEVGDGLTVGDILPVSVAPNARVLLQRGTVRQHRQQRAGVYTLGNPLWGNGQADLEWGEAEALTIAKIAREFRIDGEAKVDKDARRAWLVGALQKGLMVDASCHGRFDVNDFLNSALLLRRPEELRLGDMLSHKVDLRGLRLFILSACESASASVAGAESNEQKSLATGMLVAGAEAVIASLWPVDDYATYLLMVRFAQEWLPHMTHEAPAAALARAQCWLRTRTNSQLRQWQATALPAITAEERRAAGAETDSAPAEPLPQQETGEPLLKRIKVQDRSYRFDMEQVREAIQRLGKSGPPDACPFAHPVYWAGFQVTGW